MIFPKSYLNEIEKLTVYSDTKTNKYHLIANTFFISLFIVIILFFLIYFYNLHYLFYIASLIFLIFFSQFILYLLLYFKSESRKANIEDSLPDALHLIASNLQAGLTPYESIKAASKKKFGYLSLELKKATSKAMGLSNFNDELMKISERVDSSILKRTLKLITTSMNSGSHLAILLEELSLDISENQSLKKEMITNTKTYTMFILFTIVVGAPLLLAISVHFVDMVQNMQSSATLSTDEFGLGFLSGDIEITPDFLTNISMVILTLTSLLATMLIGTITHGKIKFGLKYAPFVMFASIILFFISKEVVTSFFSSI